MSALMRFPFLRRVERGQSISLPCSTSNGYSRQPAPSDGVVYETREDTYFIPSEMLELAGYKLEEACKCRKKPR